jgi:acetyl-CoA carboxylase carboxyl transferase subunit alpha
VIGEGCSGGAIGLSIADTLAMFSGAIYSVISPESYTSIILNSSDARPELLKKMRFTANDLYNEGLIDEVLSDGTIEYNILQIKKYFAKSLVDLNRLNTKQLLMRRYNRVRNWS